MQYIVTYSVFSSQPLSQVHCTRVSSKVSCVYKSVILTTLRLNHGTLVRWSCQCLHKSAILTILRLNQGTLVQRWCVYKRAILTVIRLLSRKLDLIRKTSQVWAAPATVPPSDPNIQKSNQYWSWLSRPNILMTFGTKDRNDHCQCPLQPLTEANTTRKPKLTAKTATLQHKSTYLAHVSSELSC